LAFALRLRKITENIIQGNNDELPILSSPYQGTQVDTWPSQVTAKLLK